MHHVSRNELSAPQGVQFSLRSPPPHLALSLTLSFVPHSSTTATFLPTCPHSHTAYSSFRELVLFPLLSERYPLTRIERGAKYIVDTRQPPMSRDSLLRRRTLMLSYMICLTLPRETLRLVVPRAAFVLLLQRARAYNPDPGTYTLRK